MDSEPRPINVENQPPTLSMEDVKTLNSMLNHEEVIGLFEHHSNLVGIGGGWKVTNKQYTQQKSIILYVKTKGLIPMGETMFPSFIQGFPTDVIEARYYPCGFDSISCSRMTMEPKIGQMLLSKNSNAFATLGAIVKKPNNETFFLTNAHVWEHMEDDISFMTPLYVYKMEINVEETLSIKNQVFEQQVIGMDAALIRCILSNVLTQSLAVRIEKFCKVKGIDFGKWEYKGLIASEELQDLMLNGSEEDRMVFKVGASTGLTVGILDQKVFHCKSNMEQPTSQMDNQLRILPLKKWNQAFCEDGDSGSVAFTFSGKAMGLIHGRFCTSISEMDSTIATPLWAICQFFDVDLLPIV